MSWWSYIQLAVLAALALAGSSVQVHHVDLAFCYDGDLEINLDPVFLVRTDFETASWFAGQAVNGFALGNIAVVCWGLDPDLVDYVTAHELTHVIQFRALGPWLLFLCNANPNFFEAHLTREQVEKLEALPIHQRIKAQYPMLIDSMWEPSSGWPILWHFYTVRIGQVM